MGIASISYDRIVAGVQRNMASKGSDEEGSNDTGEGHSCCDGHDCDCTSRVEGHDGPGKPRYDRSSKRQIEATARTKFRHDRSRSGVFI